MGAEETGDEDSHHATGKMMPAQTGTAASYDLSFMEPRGKEDAVTESTRSGKATSKENINDEIDDHSTFGGHFSAMASAAAKPKANADEEAAYVKGKKCNKEPISEFDRALSKGKGPSKGFFLQEQPNKIQQLKENADPEVRSLGPDVARETGGQQILSNPTDDQTEAEHTMGEDLGEEIKDDTSTQNRPAVTIVFSEVMELADEDSVGTAPTQSTRGSAHRSYKGSLPTNVLIGLANKRYDRRRIAAMEVERVVRGLVLQDDIVGIRDILFLLNNDYIRSTNGDTRKGGIAALDAMACGIKRAQNKNPVVQECRDLILASVVHACQDHTGQVRYCATVSLFNLVKVMPALVMNHFYILFEILRSLHSDSDLEVRAGANQLDKKLKEVIVAAMNNGSFTTVECVPVLARFVRARSKATKKLVISWLQELDEKLLGAPMLEFLHLFLDGLLEMLGDPSMDIRQSSFSFLQSILPKILSTNGETTTEEKGSILTSVNFDQILQSLVDAIEHPDPSVRKVAMYWISSILDKHFNHVEHEDDSSIESLDAEPEPAGDKSDNISLNGVREKPLDIESTPTARSIRASLPCVLSGILISIGDEYQAESLKDSFYPNHTIQDLVEKTNQCMQDAVRREGKAFVQHLDEFISYLREELDSPVGINARIPPAFERKPARPDAEEDFSRLERQGWFRTSRETNDGPAHFIATSRLCALNWITVLYQHVVPDILKTDYSQEFVAPIIRQLVDDPPEMILFKSLEVLAAITRNINGEWTDYARLSSLSRISLGNVGEPEPEFPMNNRNIEVALDIISMPHRHLISCDRAVFSNLIELYERNENLLQDLPRVVEIMCLLQPPEFVFISFAVELDRLARARTKDHKRCVPLLKSLKFLSELAHQLSYALFTCPQSAALRSILKDCIGRSGDSEYDRRRSQVYRILHHSFSHNLVSSVSLCLWAGAYRTAYNILKVIDPLDIDFIFLLQVDELIEMLERPLFRHLYVRMIENDDPSEEGSGSMAFRLISSVLLILPQNHSSFLILHERIATASRFRQTAMKRSRNKAIRDGTDKINPLVQRVLETRDLHCHAKRVIEQEELQDSEEVITVSAPG